MANPMLACLAATTASAVNIRGRVVDVDIGTQGSVVNVSAYDLITFDPFDSPRTIHHPAGLLTKNLTIMPYAVSIADGEAPFYFNHQIPGCSSMNRINPIYRNNQSAVEHQTGFCEGPGFTHGRASAWRMGLIKGCRRGTVTVKPVATVRLSRVLSAEGVRRVQYLKLDTQGSDYSILRDLLESGIHVVNVQMECQDYGRALPLYDAPNDCRDIVAYMARNYPSYRVQWHSTNCPIAEYDLVLSSNPASALSKFPTAALPAQSRLTDSRGRWTGAG